MAVIVSIADSLVSSLQASGFPTAERSAAPYLAREEIGGETRVVVFPRNVEFSSGSRGGYDQAYDLGVAVQKEVDPSDVVAVDACLEVVDNLWGLFSGGGELAEQDFAGARLAEPPQHPTGRVYEPQHLQTLRLFTSITALLFKQNY